MSSHKSLVQSAVFAALSIALLGQIPQTVQAQGNTPKDPAPVAVFQAAGPNAASIQSAVDAFRAALGNPNGNAAGPLPAGRREINWDGGGGVDATTAPVTPFNAFLNTPAGNSRHRGWDFPGRYRPVEHKTESRVFSVIRLMATSSWPSVP